MSEPRMTIPEQVTGLILAGGRATRMGGMDKGLVPIGGRPMIAWVIEALQPQVAEVLINANRNHDRYGEFGSKVIDDGDGEFRGPLAGMASGMRAAATPWIAVVPCDSPLIHGALVARLYEAATASGCSRCLPCSPATCSPTWLVISTTESVRSTAGMPGTGSRAWTAATCRRRSPTSMRQRTSARSRRRSPRAPGRSRHGRRE